jgi:hypothetical protein
MGGAAVFGAPPLLDGALCEQHPPYAKGEIPNRGDFGRYCGGAFRLHVYEAVVSDV